jgi:hypothetical protein
MKVYVVLLRLHTGHNCLLICIKCHPVHISTACCVKTQPAQWARTAHCSMKAFPKSLWTWTDNQVLVGCMGVNGRLQRAWELAVRLLNAGTYTCKVGTHWCFLNTHLHNAQTALGILFACYVSWLHQDWSGTHAHNIPRAVCVAPPAVCVAPPEDEQIMLETCRGP